MKKFFLLTILILSIILGSGYIYYQLLLNESMSKQNDSIKNMKNELILSAKESVKLKDLKLFEKLVQNLQKTTELNNVEIKITKHYFDEKLLRNRTPLIDSSWDFIEISIDDILGTINSLSKDTYEVELNPNNTLSDIMSIKFQLAKDNIIKEELFIYETHKIIESDKKLTKTNKEAYKDNEFDLSFDYNTNMDMQTIHDEMYYFSLNILIITISLILISLLSYYMIIRPKFLKNINSLNTYLKNINDGKMVKDSSLPQLVVDEFETLHENILSLTKKYVNTSNELSISRDIIFQKERTDELTRLPNKKSFINDLKYMFISNKQGFIIQLKIDKIGIFTKNHGPEIVDNLIEELAHTIKNFLNSHSNYDGSIYRFFGAEFAMVIYNITSEDLETMLKEIILTTEKLNDKYYFFDNRIYYGATGFDKYGTIESILQGAQDSYETALKEKSKFFFIADEKSQQELNQKLEHTVKDIITRNDFVLQYLYDTYNFDTTPELLMQEISPLIIDSITFESIPSGKFISVAEKLGFINDFDKALVQKVLEQIELIELTHKVCVSLSIASLSNQLFISWLEKLIKTNSYTKNLIFIAPSYSIASNYDVFTSFCSTLKKYDLEFMIKQYNPTDLELEKVKKLSPTYIRLEKTFCQDFKRDSSKQHVVKQILLFSEENNIKVIGDSVKNEQDIDTFEMLGFYGTSK